MGGPGYSFYYMFIRCPKVILQSNVIQLTGSPGYSMLIQYPKVTLQPKVIQLMGGPGYSFYYMLIQCPKVI